MANELPVRFPIDAAQEDSFGFMLDFCAVGKDVFGAGGPSKGALRFNNIQIPQGTSIEFAELKYKYGSVGTNSGSWKHKLYGLDTDNASSFTDVYPFSVSKTSAVITSNEGPPTGGGTKTFNVKDVMQEIINRGGWSLNNAIGFMIEDDGSSDDVWATATLATSYLVYRLVAEPNFLPTPVTVAAPTFPAADDFGIKISKAGVDVKTATRDQLLLTTREDVIKMKAESQVATTGGVTTLIAHGLGYKPECQCFLRKNGYSFELPRMFGGATDPVGGGVQGFYSVDATYLRIFTYADADVYYYILLDEQAT